MFPNKEYDNLTIKSVFEKVDIKKEDYEELQKEVLNYPSYKVLNTLNDERIKESLRSYISFLKNTYNGTGAEGYDERINDYLFSYKQWNIFVKYILSYEVFLKEKFIDFYNLFIESQYNAVFKIVTNNYNNYIDRINAIYQNNKFENGDFILTPLSIQKFSPTLQEYYSQYKEKRGKGMEYLLITEDEPKTVFKNTNVILLR